MGVAERVLSESSDPKLPRSESSDPKLPRL